MKRWMVVMALVANGCSLIKPGTPLTSLPKGIEWRDTRRLEVKALELLADRGPVPASVFMHCSPLIQRHVDDTDTDFQYSAVFGVTTNDQGSISSVCVWGANYDNGGEYVECLGRALASSGYRLDPDLKKERFRVNFLFDPD